MKRLQAFAFVVGFLGVQFRAAGAEDPAESTSHSTAKSPLAADGELTQLREPLAKIFQFKLDAGNLKFDRTAWESAAAEIEKKNAAAKEAEQLPNRRLGCVIGLGYFRKRHSSWSVSKEWDRFRRL
jgi:hypothetical protein